MNHHPESDEITMFVREWAKAIEANDLALMDDFVTDDWVLIDRPGIISKEAFHGAVEKGHLRHHSMTHDVLLVRRLAPEVAIVITHGRNTATFRGAAIEADEWTMDVLVHQPTGWRCVATQLTPRTAAE